MLETFADQILCGERIRDVQTQLSGLGQQAQAVDENSEVFRQQQMVEHGTQQLNVEQQIQELNTQILDAQTRLQMAQREPATASTLARDLNDQITQLKTRREQLEAQLRATGTAAQTTNSAIAGSAMAEKVEMRGEREELQRQLGDLRADLMYWQGQKRGAGKPAQDQRVEQLNQEIQTQEQRVRTLQENQTVQ